MSGNTTASVKRDSDDDDDGDTDEEVFILNSMRYDSIRPSCGCDKSSRRRRMAPTYRRHRLPIMQSNIILSIDVHRCLLLCQYATDGRSTSQQVAIRRAAGAARNTDATGGPTMFEFLRFARRCVTSL